MKIVTREKIDNDTIWELLFSTIEILRQTVSLSLHYSLANILKNLQVIGVVSIIRAVHFDVIISWKKINFTEISEVAVLANYIFNRKTYKSHV